MKVAVLHSRYRSDGPSGENVAVDQQISALDDAGVEVLPIVASTDVLRSSRFYSVKAAARVSSFTGVSPDEALEKFAPEIIHVHNLFPNFSYGWLKKWASRTVATLHNFRPICAAGTLYRAGNTCRLCPDRSSFHAVRHACYRDSSAQSIPLALATRSSGRHNPLITYSQARIALNEEARLTYRTYFPDLKFDMVPNFVWAPSSGPPRPRSGFLFAGRLVEEKGVRWLLENWLEGERLYLAGDGPLRAWIEQETEKSSKCKYLGSLERADLIRLLASVEGVVVPSMWSEGLPTIILESLAMGTPVIVSNKMGASSSLEAGGGCVGFDVTLKSSLRDAIERLRVNFPKLSVAAREQYLQSYSPEIWTRRILQVYDDVLSAPKNIGRC